jgi:hypothetical protein
LSDHAVLYGKDQWYESAQGDFSDRLADLEETYRRSEGAYERFKAYRTNGREAMIPDIVADWKTIRKAQRESVKQAKQYLSHLDCQKFSQDIAGFIEKLRGIHHSIDRLSAYRQYYERLWSLSEPEDETTQPSPNETTENLPSTTLELV